MWMMYVGIVGVKSEPFSHFIHSYILYNDFSQDKIKFLHLFQCYTEAKSLEIPKEISFLFKDGDISFNNISFFPHYFSSLISFISKSNIQCKALQFNQCHVFGNNLMNVLKQFIINNKEKMATLEYINLYNNFSDASPWIVYCAIIKHCLVTKLTLNGFRASGIAQYGDELVDSLQQNTTLKSLTLCSIETNELKIIKSALINTKCSVNNLNISATPISFKEVSLHQKSIVVSTAVHCKSEVKDRVLTINVLYEKQTTSTTKSLQLSRLNLSDYEVGCVAFGLQDNLSVESVDFSHNFITNEGIMSIRDCLLNNNVITELNISHSTSIIIAPSVNNIISVNSSLLKLDISGIPIKWYEAKMISEAIAVNNTIKELDMCCCSIGCAGAYFIAQGLNKNLSLQKLDISANGISDDGAIAVCKYLTNNSSLQDLNMSFNKITTSGTEEMAQAIKEGTKFSKLNISGNRITSKGLVMFLNTIQTNAALKTLFVQFNNITKSGILEIENCIKRFNIPQEIHASWNDIITDNRVTAMRTSYRSFNTLNPYSEMPDTTGDSVKWPLAPLKDNNYASELLSTCLQENSSLKELYFRFCITITPEGAKKVAKVLKVNKILQKLDISHQSIGNDGIVAIGNSLKINNTLQELSMAELLHIVLKVIKIL